MRRFKLIRDKDVTGVSGTGVVAEGVGFLDGTAVMRWYGVHSSTVMYDSIYDLETIHNHKGTKSEGGTRIEFID